MIPWISEVAKFSEVLVLVRTSCKADTWYLTSLVSSSWRNSSVLLIVFVAIALKPPLVWVSLLIRRSPVSLSIVRLQSAANLAANVNGNCRESRWSRGYGFLWALDYIFGVSEKCPYFVISFLSSFIYLTVHFFIANLGALLIWYGQDWWAKNRKHCFLIWKTLFFVGPQVWSDLNVGVFLCFHISLRDFQCKYPVMGLRDCIVFTWLAQTKIWGFLNSWLHFWLTWKLFLLRYNLYFMFYLSHGAFLTASTILEAVCSTVRVDNFSIRQRRLKNVKLMRFCFVFFFWILQLVQHNFLTPIHDLSRVFFSYNLNGVQNSLFF